MSQFHSPNVPFAFSNAGLRIIQALVLALAVVLSLSAHAADARVIKSKVSPAYPEIAKRMRITGLVKVEATVDADGKVTAVKALSGNSMLSPAAEDAVRKWRFAPAPAESTVEVEVNFALAE
jgi:TonB family protein